MLNGVPKPSDSSTTRSTPHSAQPRPVKINVLVSPGGRRTPVTSTTASPEPDRLSGAPLSADEINPFEEAWDEAVDGAPVQVWVAPRDYSLLKGLTRAMAWLGLWSAIATLVAGSGWLAVRLIVNPGSVTWLQWMMPDWNRTPLTGSDVAHTRNEIRAQLGNAELTLGQPMILPKTATQSTADWLFPVLASDSRCTGPSCQHIVEMRVYRPTQTASAEPAFRLIDRLAVKGPEEFFVVSPLVRTVVDSQGSTRSLPLTDVSLLGGQPPATGGTWLTLSGQWQKGSTAIAYGRLLHYDPDAARLWVSELWASPTQTLPFWSQVTANGNPELVVNQTVGLEPDLKVYQVVSRPDDEPPLRLQAISLQQPALTQPSYKNALTLAQNGLWSPALNTLIKLKARSQDDPSRWPAAAQMQMDVIALHAKATKAQASRNWGSASQRILAQIIDGQLGAALQSLETALRQGEDLSLVLRDNSGQIWRRVTALLRVHPKQADAQTWGTLVMAVRGNRNAAIAWLQQRLEQTGLTLTQAAPLNDRTQRVLRLLDQVPTSQTIAAHTSQIVGTAQPIAGIKSGDWLAENTELQLAPGQRWYRVQVARFFDGQQWQQSPFRLNISPLDQRHQLWQMLGLQQHNSLQLLTWAPDGTAQPIAAAARAVQLSGSTLNLLVAADAQPTGAIALAVSDSTLRWQEPQGALTLADLSLQSPAFNAAIPRLWQALYPQTAMPAETSAVLQTLGTLAVEPLTIRGTAQPDYRLKLALPSYSYTEAANPALPAGSALAASQQTTRTLLLSDQGTILFNDAALGAGSIFRGVVTIGDSAPLLLIETPDAYRFLSWSSQNQRFE